MSENPWGPPEVVEKIARELERRAESHKRVAKSCPDTSDYRREMYLLADECEKIALHLREGRDHL